ncbi:MAG: ATP-binding protein [Candidatus Diapherotrites archaeon]|uniref:ATP-binding protein n=1 Tax=Candidatus Iainarchaeum sp. TaxID=3101447 RepID=A0A8T3YK73_9ARCH|nr:ATP-binding protein [Candidatus Diapherotrites archaeon]
MLSDVLVLQKRELEARLAERFIERDAKLRNAASDTIKVIIGPRRAGKSFFAIHELRKLGSFGYVNFDDEQLAKVEDFNEVLAAIDSLYGSPRFLLLDEVQNFPKWELLANRLQRQGRNLFLTGSNSNLLSAELATHLTGRHTLAYVFPFSFKEFLALEKKELTSAETKQKLLDFVTYGGFPEPLVKKMDYADYVSRLFDNIMYKDIISRYKLRRIKTVREIAQILFSNVTKEFSYNQLKNSVQKTSVVTLQRFISYLEEAFVFFEMPRFSFKAKEQAKYNKKIYCFDNGYIFAKAFKTSPDWGGLFENAVAIELKKGEIEHEHKVFYWKNAQNHEVDFAIQKDRKISRLIQVCFDPTDPKTKKREERALLRASHELNCQNLLVLTNDYEATQKTEWFGLKGTVKYKPLWKWLLEN